MKTLANLLDEHLCVVNTLLGPVTIHYERFHCRTGVIVLKLGLLLRLVRTDRGRQG